MQRKYIVWISFLLLFLFPWRIFSSTRKRNEIESDISTEENEASEALPKSALAAFLDSYPYRELDSYGYGHFGASRAGGTRIHRGQDYLAAVGDRVETPFAGVVRRIGYPYSDDLSYRLVELEMANGHLMKIMYIEPAVDVGDSVLPGDVLGYQQDLTKKFPGMPNHFHLEYIVDGEHRDPRNYIK
jgi:murein DD-endopeptidase MepM/ murein hydrolase activator NlpD